MQRGVIICLKKNGEFSYKYPILDEKICLLGPGTKCHVRFITKESKGAFCSVSSNENGCVQLKKLTSCSVLVNGIEINDAKELAFGDSFEIEGAKFLWQENDFDSDSIANTDEKNFTKRISSTMQIHGRQSINEFRATKKFNKSTNSSFCVESNENVSTSKKNADNVNFEIATSPVRLTYPQPSAEKPLQNFSFKIKLKSPRKATPRRASIKKTPAKSTTKSSTPAVKTPKSSTPAVKTPKSAANPLTKKTSKSAIDLLKTVRSLRSPRSAKNQVQVKSRSETKKYFESTTSKETGSKIPRKYFFTPPKASTPRPNVKNPSAITTSVAETTYAQKARTPRSVRKPSPVQITKKSPKSTNIPLKQKVETPKSTKKIISSTPKNTKKPTVKITPLSLTKSAKQLNKTPKISPKNLRSPGKINKIKTPLSSVKRKIVTAPASSTKIASKNVKTPKSIEKITPKLAPKSPLLSPVVSSPAVNRSTRKSQRISVSNRKSSIKKFVRKKRKYSGSGSFEPSPKRRFVTSYSSFESEKENNTSSYVARSPAKGSDEIEICGYKGTDKMFNSYVYLEKANFTPQLRSASRRKALTQPKLSVRKTRRMSAPGRYLRLLKLESSNTSTPKQVQPQAEVLRNVLVENRERTLTPIVSINVNYNTNITYTENFESRLRTSLADKSYGSHLSGINQLSSNSDLIEFDSPQVSFTKRTSLRKSRSLQRLLQDGNLDPNVALNISNRKSWRRSLQSPKPLLNFKVTKLNESRSKPQQKSPENNLANISGIKRLINLANSPKNDLRDIKGLKKIFASPKIRHSPRNDLSDVRGIKKLMQTPGRKQKSPKNDLTEVGGVKTLLRTPNSPKNDLRNVEGVKRTMTAKSPYNDLTNVAGVRNLFRSIKLKRSPRNSLTNVAGVKKLMSTPKQEQKSPTNDLSDVRGVRTLLRTPKSPADVLENVGGVKRLMSQAPVDNLSDVRGVRNLMRTPKAIRSPRNELTNLSGVGRLLRSPRLVSKKVKNDVPDVEGIKTLFERVSIKPTNDLSNVSGVREIFETPKPKKTPRNDLSDLRGVRTLLATPRGKPKSPRNDLSDVAGVKELMVERKSPRNDLTNVSGVKKLMTVKPARNDLTDVEGVDRLFNTRRSSLTKSTIKTRKSGSNVKEDKNIQSPRSNSLAERSRKKEKRIETQVTRSPMPKANAMDDLFDKLIDDKESSVDEAIQKLMHSTPKRTYERRTKSLSPTKVGTSSPLQVVARNSDDIQKWVDAQNKYVLVESGISKQNSPRVVLNEADAKATRSGTKSKSGQKTADEVVNTRATRKRKIVEENADITNGRTRSRRAKQNETVDAEKAVTPRKRTRKQQDDEKDKVVIAPKTRSKRQKDEDSTPATNKVEVKLTRKRSKKDEADLTTTPVVNEVTKNTRQRSKRDILEPESAVQTPDVKDQDEGKRNLRGKQVEVNDAKQNKETKPATRGKRKAQVSEELENDEQVKPANKKVKTKNTRSHKDVADDISEKEEIVPKKTTRSKSKTDDKETEVIVKTRRLAKSTKTDKEESEDVKEGKGKKPHKADEVPAPKKTRTRTKSEKSKENDEPDRATKKSTKRQAKKSDQKNEENEEIQPGRRTRRRAGATAAETADNPDIEKPSRKKTANTSSKQQSGIEEEETKKRTRNQAKGKEQKQEEEVKETRRSARTRNGK